MEGFFKTAVGGFKKEDVLNYIDKQDAEFHRKENELQDQLRRLASQLDQEKQERASLEEKVTGLTQMLEQEKQKSDALASRLGEAEGNAEQCSADFGRLRAENERLAAENRKLRQDTDFARSELNVKNSTIEDLRSAIGRVENTQDRISRVLIEAQATADRMIASARAKSAVLIGEAQRQCEELLTVSDVFRSDVAALRRNVGTAAEKMSGTLQTLEEEAGSLRATYAGEFDKLRDGGPAVTETATDGPAGDALKETAAGCAEEPETEASASGR